jgi:hypothetical protein
MFEPSRAKLRTLKLDPIWIASKALIKLATRVNP